MNTYDTWIDADGKCHLLCEMETKYIQNCIKQIDKAADNWRMIVFSDLTIEDKQEIQTPMRKAWFVVNALPYLHSFQRELASRNEDTTNTEKIIKRIIAARNDL